MNRLNPHGAQSFKTKKLKGKEGKTEKGESRDLEAEKEWSKEDNGWDSGPRCWVIGYRLDEGTDSGVLCMAVSYTAASFSLVGWEPGTNNWRSRGDSTSRSVTFGGLEHEEYKINPVLRPSGALLITWRSGVSADQCSCENIF